VRILDILGGQLAEGRRWLSKTDDQPLVHVVEPAAPSSEDQDSPWEVSSDSEPEPESGKQPSQLSNQALSPKAKQLLEATELAVRCLYIIPLRKPAPMDRLQDRFVEDREPSPYAEFDTRYIQDKFPALAPLVQKRLARMTTRRRRLLVYRQQHNERLVAKEKLSDTGDDDSPDSEDGGGESDDDGDAPENVKRPENLRTGPATQYTKATTIRIDHDVQAVAVEGLAKTEPKTAHVDDDARTSVTGSRATREIRLEVPPRPRQSDGSPAVLFQCRYCCLPVQISGEREWRYGCPSTAPSLPTNKTI